MDGYSEETIGCFEVTLDWNSRLRGLNLLLTDCDPHNTTQCSKESWMPLSQKSFPFAFCHLFNTTIVTHAQHKDLSASMKFTSLKPDTKGSAIPRESCIGPLISVQTKWQAQWQHRGQSHILHIGCMYAFATRRATFHTNTPKHVIIICQGLGLLGCTLEGRCKGLKADKGV